MHIGVFRDMCHQNVQGGDTRDRRRRRNVLEIPGNTCNVAFGDDVSKVKTPFAAIRVCAYVSIGPLKLWHKRSNFDDIIVTGTIRQSNCSGHQGPATRHFS